ncbi:MAG: ATP phosphoribosyltransferase regulatory subunit [Erysipelotrichaceae bacterium]|nr:ATP phosphoribosyltransferase regulatory subunit [Erysipelotrichaceae bacterium]
MLEQKLNALFEASGYRKFRMSKFEEYDLYAENRDFLKSSQIITFTDLDGSLLALKPDITLSIIKNNRGQDEKVYYNEMVYRPKNHHYCEIPQTGIECIGYIHPYEEAEVISLAAHALACITHTYALQISDAAYLPFLLKQAEVPEYLGEDLQMAIRTKNTGAIRELKLPAEITDKLCAFTELHASLSDGIHEAEQIAGASEITDHLKQLAGILEALGVLDHCYLDFSLVNSMDYYNGVIFQGLVPEVPAAILSGGRYDRLPEKMGRHVGAVGFAIDMDAVENAFPEKPAERKRIRISYSEADDLKQLASIVTSLQKQGYQVETGTSKSPEAISLAEAEEMLK